VATGGGLDEVTLEGSTHLWFVESGRADRKVWQPNDFGLTVRSAGDLAIGNARESATQIERMLNGAPGPVRDYVLANTAAALWVTGRYSLSEGIARARSAVDSGEAARLLARWKKLAPATGEP
jgi:anthranilate phosphoribosyltransferase